MSVYRIEATVDATLYVRADSAAEALDKAREYVGGETPDASGADFDSPDLPEVSVSPVSTLRTLDSEPEEVE